MSKGTGDFVASFCDTAISRPVILTHFVQLCFCSGLVEKCGKAGPVRLYRSVFTGPALGAGDPYRCLDGTICDEKVFKIGALGVLTKEKIQNTIVE